MELGLGSHLAVGLVGDDSVESGYRPPRARELGDGAEVGVAAAAAAPSGAGLRDARSPAAPTHGTHPGRSPNPGSDRPVGAATFYAGRVMRTTLAYTSARILLLVVSLVLLYLVGARGLLLLALACLVSGIASFVLLSRQRDRMSGALMARIRTGRGRVAGFRARLEEGARAEDDD